jgi:hypothetical protein
MNAAHKRDSPTLPGYVAGSGTSGWYQHPGAPDFRLGGTHVES